MKNKYTAVVFIMAALVCGCVAACYNPIMEKWWDDDRSSWGVPSGYNWGKYTVQFDMVGGTYVDELDSHRPRPDTQVIEAGKNVMDPGLPKKDPQAFGGWYTEPSGGKRWHFGSGGDAVNSNMTLYAHWGAVGHDVLFRETDGNPIDTGKAVYRPVDEKIVHGELATEPLQFGAKENSTSFEGWYTDTSCTDLWDFKRDTVTAKVTLYAKWVSQKEYTIEWVAGTSSDPYNPLVSPDSMHLADGVKIPQPVAITNPGYAFAGWYTSSNFTHEWNFAEDKVGPTYAAGTTITLYAKWTTPGMSGTGDGPGAGKTFTLGGSGYPNTNGGVTVTIKRNFYIDQYEITNERYLAVMGNVPSRGQGSNMPLNRITWYDALEYCNKLSDREGLNRVYTLSSVTRGKDGAVSFIKNAYVQADFSQNGYRLPTEAEWEYAARGGQAAVDNPFIDYQYSGSNNVDEVAWYDGNSGFVPHPVGQKKPNAIGLYDMSGNLSEWCWDMYNSTIYGSYAGATDPRNDYNPSKAPPERVRRGGNFNMINVKVRSRDNNNTNPTFSWPPAPADDSLQRYMTIGFRVVRTIPEP